MEGAVVVGSGHGDIHGPPGFFALYCLGGAGDVFRLFQTGFVHRSQVSAHGLVRVGKELVEGVVVGYVGLDSLIVPLLEGLNQGVYHLFVGQILRFGHQPAGGQKQAQDGRQTDKIFFHFDFSFYVLLRFRRR